jgi:hypothetical protein
MCGERYIAEMGKQARNVLVLFQQLCGNTVIRGGLAGAQTTKEE